MSIEIELPEIKAKAEKAYHEFQAFGGKINADGYTPTAAEIEQFEALRASTEAAQNELKDAISKREDAQGRNDRANHLAKMKEAQEKYAGYQFTPRDQQEANYGRQNVAQDYDQVFSAWAANSENNVSEEDVRKAKALGLDPFKAEFAPLPMVMQSLPDGRTARFVDMRGSGRRAFEAYRRFHDQTRAHAVKYGAASAVDFAANYMAADPVADSRQYDNMGMTNQLPTVLTTFEANVITYGGVLDHPITIRVTPGYEDVVQDIYDDTSNTAVQISENSTIGQNKVAILGRIVWKYFDYSSNDYQLSNRQLDVSRYDLPRIIGEALGIRHGRTMGSVLTTGNGVSEPEGYRTGALKTGFTNSKGNAKIVTTASPTAIAYDEVSGNGLEYALDQIFADAPNAGWSMHRTTLGYLETVKDSYGRPMFQLGQETTTNRKLLRNRPVFFNTFMDTIAATKYPIMYGDWSQVVLRRAGGGVPMFIRDTTSARRQLQTIFTAIMTYDQRLVNLGNMPLAVLQMHA